MHYKQILIAVMTASVFVSLQGCGMFGSKQDPSSILTYQTANAGCLDNVGTQVKEYSTGTISEADLTAAWNCVNSSLTLFTQFIRGSVPNGYTTQDIQVFISHFLFSQATISPALVQSAFALKASIFGGDPNVLTFDEMNGILAFISVLQTETTNILPFLETRVQNPTPKNLTSLSNAIRAAGKHIGSSLQTAGNPTFTAAQLQTLVTELQNVISTSAVSANDQSAQFVISIKQVLALGGSDGIEGSTWPTFIQGLFNYLGPALSALSYSPSFATGANQEDGFFTKTLGQLISALDATIQVNGGSIPFSAISNIIQYVPDAYLNAAQRTAVSGAQNMIFSRILQSKTSNAIDQNVTSYLSKQVNFWDSVESTLNTVYSTNGFDPVQGATADQLTAALTAYSPTPSSPNQAAVQWITALIQNYKPYFAGTDQEVMFSGALNSYSMHDMEMKHLIRLASTALLNAYSTASDKTEIDLTDFSTFINDVSPVLAAWQMADSSIPGGAQARYLQASLFMPSSVGGSYITLDEGSQYILYFLSIYHQAKRVEPVLSGTCASYGTDAYGTPLMNAQCFRTNYFANYLTFWDRMPLLTKYYESLSSNDQQALEVAIEMAARRYGYSDQCVGLYDVEGFSGILHYIETILERFDTTGEGILTTADAMTAFPVFQSELITAGAASGLSATDTGEQEAAFAYALARGKLPTKGVEGDIEFLWWWIIVGKDHWNIKAARNSLFKVIGSISPPPTPTTASQCE
jgi:hypothetical protein